MDTTTTLYSNIKIFLSNHGPELVRNKIVSLSPEYPPNIFLQAHLEVIIIFMCCLCFYFYEGEGKKY